MDESALRGLGAVSSPDPQTQAQAMHYFEQLKNSADGWKLCAQAFSTGLYQGNDHVRFFCLQVCEHYLKNRYQQADRDEQNSVRVFLMSCLQLASNEGTQERTFILNKVAQIVSLAFVFDYPSRWPSFFEDILRTLNQGHKAVGMYLRVMLAIDQEVVDREVIHSAEESVRNTAIKDHMRETCVAQVADSWLQIMTAYETSQPELVCMCLDVVGKYVSWIEITLVANDRFVPVLLRFLNQPLLRESAADCIYEVISKGMDPMAKLRLVESFFTVLDGAGVLNPPEDEEGDYLAKLSKLVCGVGQALICSWNKLHKTGNAESDLAEIQTALEAKIPYMLRFLGNEDDDVSGAVADFATEYIALLKTKGPPLSPTQRNHVEGMLYTVVKKMKYDECYNFEQEGEDEAMFMDYRKQMRVIFNNLAQLDSDLILMTVHTIVTQTLAQWEAADFRDVEMALTLLYSVAEAVPASHGQHFSGNSTKVSALQNMMRLLVTSRVSCHGHVIVQLQFFETAVRYDKFFQVEPEHIPDVLMAFLDKRGLHHESPKVRSRCSYLFSRIVKSLKNHLLPYLEEVFSGLQDLLVLNAPAGSSANGVPHLLSDEDQLFVYETASTLIISSTLAPEKKQELMKSLLTPIASKFEGLLGSLCNETSEDQQAAYAKCIYNAMALASRASKGFSGTQTMRQCGCVPAFTELLRLFGMALDTPSQRSHIQAGVRQYLHRMVVCMDAQILPFIPPVLTHLLKHPEARELYDFLPLVNQLVMKFKAEIIPFLSEILMPLVNAVFSVLMSPADERDQEAASDRKFLRRGYFLFLSTIVSNDCINVLKALEMGSVNQVLMSVVQGVVEVQDPPSQRCCFMILKKLTEAWGSGNDGIVGFPDFLYKNVIPACILAPLSPSFDLNDGQTSLALGECATCLKTILEKRGEELTNYLQKDYLPSLHMSTEQSQEFCQALHTDQKTFKAYLKNFFMKAKS
ncbi:exportin-T-like [Littorina saxatilis]|uniref:Exportin-T n=1 Tax=Littorina saxatilis TaxID=31220 RepID=A0AAN9GBJ8_9CAEN